MNPEFLVIDLFCGAGGTTTGFEKARIGRRRIAKVIACVNHDPYAIASHASNHKSVLHFTEDIRTLELGSLIRHVERMQKRYPDAKLVLWASLECTNFSKAKGGQPRDADSRTLAEHLFRYLTIGVGYVMIENVEEFMSWGALDENGKPIKKREGEDFVRWVSSIKSLGYNYEHRLINSADFGAYTSRTRYFAIFARPELPIVFPEPTHSKKPIGKSLFTHPLRKWKPVKDVMDLEDEGREIFERKKPLSEKTLQRIYAGLIKFVAGGKDAFIMKMNSGNPSGMCTDIENPTGTLTTKCHQAIVQSSFIVQRNSGNPESKICSIESPARTITATGGNLCFIATYHGNGHNCHSVENPAPAVVAADTLASVHAEWIDNQFGNGFSSSANEPLGTIVTNPKQNVVKAQFIDMQFSQGKRNESIESPCGSLTTVPKKNLVTAKFLINGNSSTAPSRGMDEPCFTVTSNRTHFIINPSWGGNPGSVDQPCPVIVARQDKAPLYLTFTDGGEVAIKIYSTDSETTVLIKKFMALYGIGRITMRMLKVDELKLIMGLPRDYVLCGNQGKQKWMIGNMVHPLVPKAMARCLSRKFSEMKKQAVA